MGQKSVIRSGIINIRTHPHSAELYEQLLRSIYGMKRAAKLRGDRYAVISLLQNAAGRDGVLEGILTAFTKIDQNSDWFDLENLEEASTEKVSEIEIPSNLFPNPRSFYFNFDVNSHRLYLQTYSKGVSISIRDATKMFESLFRSEEILEEFGDVKVNMVQKANSLRTVYGMKKITKIRIRIEKPNSDVFDDDFEENIEKHLEDTNSRQVELTYSSERGASIAVNDDIKKVSEPALANGVIEVEGQSDVGREKRSTREHPEILQEEYDTDQQTEAQALRELVGRQ